MKRYYIADETQPKGFVEVTENEFHALVGCDEIRNYVMDVYHNEIPLSAVPEELREQVQTVVNNKIARWGTYENRNISDAEALNILTGGDDK